LDAIVGYVIDEVFPFMANERERTHELVKASRRQSLAEVADVAPQRNRLITGI